MDRGQWYALYQDVRTGIIGENLFPEDQRASIALLMAKADRKERWTLARGLTNAKAN